MCIAHFRQPWTLIICNFCHVARHYSTPSVSHRTAVVGFGRVPTDTISIEVIIIIIVALGIPAILVFLGGFYVTYKKKPWQNVGRGFRR